MSGHVATRYYTAPELLTSGQTYDSKMDIWSSGCILAEMLEGKPLFPGKDAVDQFCIITQLLGSPNPDSLKPTCTTQTIDFIKSLPQYDGYCFDERFEIFGVTCKAAKVDNRRS